MKKQIGSTCLVAGTAIGAGMIALPIVLAQLGLLFSICLMAVVWAVMYYTALLTIEVNLRNGKGAPLGILGRAVSGRWAEVLGNTCLKLLSYALLAAYVNGGASVINSIATQCFSKAWPFESTATWYAAGLSAILLSSVKAIDYCNRLLFIGLLGLIFALIAALLCQVQVVELPLLPSKEITFQAWIAALPIVFTAFGFHVVFHTIVNYCEMDAASLRRAAKLGSLIPLAVYAAWTIGVLGVIHAGNPSLYQEMVHGGVEVGRMVSELSSIMKWPTLGSLSLIVSLLAILTSVLGVGLGLADSLEHYATEIFGYSKNTGRVIGVLLTIVPPYIVAIVIPGAFIQALSFAGMILVAIAIFIPLYLLHATRPLIQTPFYDIVEKKWARITTAGIGLAIVVCEIVNIYQRT
jgi:tyrosine-specific transport protein